MLLVVALLQIIMFESSGLVVTAFVYHSWVLEANTNSNIHYAGGQEVVYLSSLYYDPDSSRERRRSRRGIDRMALRAALSDSSDEETEPDDNNSTGNDRNDGDGKSQPAKSSGGKDEPVPSPSELQLLHRVTQLEQLVAAQQVQIRKLLGDVRVLTENMSSFDQVIELLREAGRTVEDARDEEDVSAASAKNRKIRLDPATASSTQPPKRRKTTTTTVATDPLVEEGIFSSAPASVLDAADAAGAAILAGLLAGKQRMLVDVRDAELSNAETLVQFIELAILPVAAGLQGLRSPRNRLKIVFPTVSQLLMYRKTMALAEPEVVALSTLGFDPVEEKDSLVVILAPAPDDEEGLTAMNDLFLQQASNNSLTQRVVVLNHHMVPVSGPAADFDVAYHLRLLSVHYMTEDGNSNSDPEAPYFSPKQPLPTSGSASGSGFEKIGRVAAHNISYAESEEDNDEQSQTSSLLDRDTTINTTATTASYSDPASTGGDDCDGDEEESHDNESSTSSSLTNTSLNATLAADSPTDNPVDNDDMVAAATSQLKDAALEAAMKHAHEVGTNRGFTRAMVIRAYPQPWHVFVDTSPDTDADFEVAALFDEEPSSDEVNRAIVECLEGSEREDELVAQQMQQALESGQLDRISEMLWEMGLENLDEDEDEDDEDDPYRDIFGADTV